MKAFIFDLDGTLIDSVYARAFAWQKALSEFGLEIPAYSIHRRIGLSGKLLVRAVAREHGKRVSMVDLKHLESDIRRCSIRLRPSARHCPGHARYWRFFINLRYRMESPRQASIGDAIWDVHAARRAGILSVGLLTGGFGEQELYNAGAMRVYRDAAELLTQIDELGIQGRG